MVVFYPLNTRVCSKLFFFTVDYTEFGCLTNFRMPAAMFLGGWQILGCQLQCFWVFATVAVWLVRDCGLLTHQAATQLSGLQTLIFATSNAIIYTKSCTLGFSIQILQHILQRLNNFCVLSL